MPSSGVELPEAGTYAAGMAFLPTDDAEAAEARTRFEEIATEEGLTVLGWREVPIEPEVLGHGMSRAAMPAFAQVFVTAAGEPQSGIELDRTAYCLRKRAEHELEVYFPSLSSRTLVYKGMLTPEQLEGFFPDLADPRMESAMAIVHSRFSTNTFPSWPLAHPFRFIAHNGEINTARGNRNWMRAREALLESDLIPGDMNRLFPVCDPLGSDTASFDEVLELLHLGGRSLPHAVMMMIPEAWENDADMDPARRAFYEFHSSVMEPWDGPAAIAFTDGNQIGAVLDRNGLRPGRYWVTEDGLVVLASEAGVLDIDQKTITRKGRLEPGKMFLLDLDQHRIIEDHEIKNTLASENPYDEWLYSGLVRFEDLPDLEHIVHTHASVTRRQQVFGYTEEELRLLIAPIARAGAEAIGSMGTDTPIAAISDRPRQLFDYFSQLFAQVTNPPLDAIREEVVTSLAGTIGPERNLLAPSPASCRMLQLPFPVLDNDELAKIRHMNKDGDMPGFSVHVVRGLYDVARWRDRPQGQARRDLRGSLPRDRQRRTDHRAVGPALQLRPRTDPVAPADRRGAPPHGAREAAYAGWTHHRGRRRPRGAPCRAADRLRRNRGQPLPRAGVRRGPGSREGVRRGRRARQGAAQRRVRTRQGRAQGHEQDGRLDRRVLHRRADLRGCRAVAGDRRGTTSPARRPSSAASASTSWPRRSARGTSRHTRRAASPRPAATSRSAASTSGAARARSTCSIPRRSSACSTPRVRAATRSSSSTRHASMTSRSGS